MFGLFGAISQINGSSFNNRRPQDDRAYRQVMDFQASVRQLRHKPNPKQAHAQFRAGMKSLQVFVILAILFAISEWVILPHLHG